MRRRRGGASPGVDRVSAFSDGVFAIAITLLVLDVRAPTSDDLRAHGGSLLLALLGQWPVYLSYLATFFAVGVIWLNHHAFFDRVRAVDGALLRENLALLLGVSFTPFPTALLADALGRGVWSADARTAAAVYALVFALGNVPWLFLTAHLIARPELLKPPNTVALVRRERRRGVIGVVGYGLLIPVAALVPLAAVVVFLAAGIYFTATARTADADADADAEDRTSGPELAPEP